MRHTIWIAALVSLVWTTGMAFGNPGYGGKCYQCHVGGQAGGSGDLNGVGAKYAREIRLVGNFAKFRGDKKLFHSARLSIAHFQSDKTISCHNCS